ncbi:g9608 [Coccomyxa viridis]|uniref:G9608 protein n=1 Tax=Coccomyxa viridis TaxID=1274662 RepID=A0ABP1G639_9CHLO
MSDSGDESATSSCGSSASFRSAPRSFSFSAPTNSPSSDEGTSKQASASSLVSPILLQSQGFQEGWLRELKAMGVPTTDNLDEALQSEGRLAYMPPRKKRPTPSASSIAFPPSPFKEASLQEGSSQDTGFTSMLPGASLRLPAPVFSQTLPAQIRSPLFGCDCPICTGIAIASASPRAPAAAGDKSLQGAIAQGAHIPSSWGIAAALASGNLSPPDRLEPQTPPRVPMLPNTAQASFASAQDVGFSV